MRPSRPLAAAALLGAALLLWPGPARALFGQTEGAFGLGGSLRTIIALSDNYDFEPLFGSRATDEFLQGLLRLTAAGRPGKQVSYEVHLVQDYTYATARLAAGSTAPGLGAPARRYRALDATWDWYDQDQRRAAAWFDRASLKIALPRADLTVGRQALTFGKAYFWNPLDVYLPFDPAQFDRDYKPGVDAARLDVYWGPFSGFTLVGVLGRELDLAGSYLDPEKTWAASWYGSSILARCFTNLGGWDLALQGGKIYGGYQLGGGLVGEFRGLEVRAEAAYFIAEDSPALPPPLSGDLLEDHFTAVLGLGRRFENTLVLEFEYLYNGGGEAEDLAPAWARFQSGALLHLSRHLAGLTASYDFLPILVGRLALIYALSDPSAQVQPSVQLSVSDNAELLFGANLNFGRQPGQVWGQTRLQSEFGTYPDSYFAEIKVYF